MLTAILDHMSKSCCVMGLAVLRVLNSLYLVREAGQDKLEIPAAASRSEVEIFISYNRAVGIVYDRIMIVPKSVWSFIFVFRTIAGSNV